MSMAKMKAFPTEPAAASPPITTSSVPAAVDGDASLPPLSLALNAVANASLSPVTLGFALFHFFGGSLRHFSPQK